MVALDAEVLILDPKELLGNLDGLGKGRLLRFSDEPKEGGTLGMVGVGKVLKTARSGP